MPVYHFKIAREGKTDEVRGLVFPDDSAALKDAQLALGDEMRDAALSPSPVSGSVAIEVFNQDGASIGRFPGHIEVIP